MSRLALVEFLKYFIKTNHFTSSWSAELKQKTKTKELLQQSQRLLDYHTGLLILSQFLVRLTIHNHEIHPALSSYRARVVKLCILYERI